MYVTVGLLSGSRVRLVGCIPTLILKVVSLNSGHAQKDLYSGKINVLHL